MANSQDEDLLQVGTHCHVKDCSRLDFLPFKCPDCEGVFCLDHRLGSSHACPVPEPQRTAVPSNHEFHSCQATACVQRESVRLECSLCHGNFCFTHRHAEDHNCPAEAGKNSEIPHVNRPDLHLPDTLIQPIPAPKSKKSHGPMALKLYAMKLKMNAIGEPQIMDEHRLYLEIILLDDSTKSVFVDDGWSFGRASDSIKRILKVNFAHEKAILRDATALDTEISPDRPIKEVVPNGGTLQFLVV